MSDKTVQLPANTVTTVAVSLALNSTIYNSSADTDVWISSQPYVAVNAGMRIGPKGSVQWSSNNEPCYAIANGSTVAIVVSDNVSSLTNPVDVATATATQILNTGVPSVMSGNLLFDNSQSANTGQQNITGISKYANLSIRLQCQDSPQFWTLEYWDASLTHRYYQTTIPAAFTGSDITLDSTVRGDTLVIKWTNTASLPSKLLITVYGSNRVVSEQVTNGTGSYGAVFGPQAMTQFTAYTLPGTFTTDGGMHRLILDTSGTNAATATGMLQLGTVDYQGNPLYIEIAQITLNDQGKGGWGQSMHQENVILPRGAHSFRWQHLTSGASISYQLSVAIYPG